MVKGPLRFLSLLALALAVLFLVPTLASCGGRSPAATASALDRPTVAPSLSQPPYSGRAAQPDPSLPLSPTPTETPEALAADPTADPTDVPDTSNDDGSPDEGGVTPGAYCSTGGDTGHHGGHLYTCKGPGRLRWRR